MTKIFGIKTSNIQGNTKTISSFALILILAISMIIVFVQPTLAQVGVPQPDKTTGYIDVAPRLLGVGQEATVNIFIYPLPTNYAYRPYFDGFRGVEVTFIRPDGTNDTFLPVDGTGSYVPGQTQALGAIYFFYKPAMAGNWSVSFTMPAQNLTDSSGTVLYLGCTSNTATFTVQTDPVLAGLLNGYPWSPLPDPNVFWSNPINTNNREWYKISGDWLGSSSTRGPINGPGQRLWQPYGKGPTTGHVVWDIPYRQGGLVGGDYGSLAYGAQGSNLNFVIMQGKVYTNIPNAGKFEAIDLTTGEVLFTQNGSITGGWHSPGSAHTQSNLDPSVLLESSYGHSYTPYLFQTAAGTWNYWDPFTGTLMRSFVNASSSAQLVDGSNLAFGVYGSSATVGGNLFVWNFSKVVNNNWPTGIEWQKPLPNPQGGNALNIFGVSPDLSTIVVSGRVNEFYGYSATDGTSLWNLTLNYPVTANEAFCMQGVNDFVILDPVASTFKAYSMTTGALLWTSASFSDAAWATTWTVYWSTTNDNENLYSIFSDGTMRAYSLTDGHEVWRSKAIVSTEYPNNVVPYVNNVVLVDGKLYGFAGYTSQYKINPISRFGMIVAINATNGDTLFTLNGGIRVSATADGYVIGTGDYDGNLYALGKGKTQTTVTAPLTTVPAGTGVLIQGSVMDMSPASPNTPAVSDADMSEWMDYLHMQNATLLNNPPVPNGVTVKLSALDSKGQVVDLGTATSDYAGQFAVSWKPTTEGLYKIFATFEGSNAYYSSYAEISLSVGAAQQAPTDGGGSTAAQPDNTMLLYGILVAVVIAIVLALIAIVAIFRKR